MTPVKIAIFASGSGSNAENIAKHFAGRDDIIVATVLSNKPDAFVIQRANKLQIEVRVFNKHEFYESCDILNYLKQIGIDWIVLAGFLWLIPEYMVNAYPDKIINIHPALLPKYGGKGMYGEKVHQTVIDNGERESGITIHIVNREYDKGKIIFQARCSVEPSDTAETLAGKVHQLEYKYFPEVIEKLILS